MAQANLGWSASKCGLTYVDLMSGAYPIPAVYRCGADVPLRRMTRLYHGVHLPQARSIIADGEIARHPVRDGRLADSGIEVLWVSPTRWSESIYGTLRFAIDPTVLLEKPWRFYWVEEKTTDYQAVPRILLSLQDRTAVADEFDPRRAGGPILLDALSGTFAIPSAERAPDRKRINYELAIEGSAPLIHQPRRVVALEFVSHVDGQRAHCRVAACPEQGRGLGADWVWGAYRVLAHCLAEQRGDVMQLGEPYSWGVALYNLLRLNGGFLRASDDEDPTARDKLQQAFALIGRGQGPPGRGIAGEIGQAIDGESPDDVAARDLIVSIASWRAVQGAVRELLQLDPRHEQIRSHTNALIDKLSE